MCIDFYNNGYDFLAISLAKAYDTDREWLFTFP